MNNINKARQNLIDMYVKSLEEGEIPWEKMWKTKQPYNAISKKKYRGINNLILSFIAMKRGYKDIRWCTYKQMKKNKWTFKKDVEVKGKGICIEYWSRYNVKEKKNYTFKEYERIIKENPERKEEFRLVTRCTTVFNADLIEGIPKDLSQEESKEQIKTSEFIDNIIKNIDVKYLEEGEEAFYDLIDDCVVIPPSNLFKNEYSYYATQLHELSHSTGNKKRLNRDLSGNFGSVEYAKEELRAEISSSFLMQELGLEYDERHLKNHKAYIQNWLQIIKDKPNELFKAINDSDKIVSYLEENSLHIDKDLGIEKEALDFDMELEYV